MFRSNSIIIIRYQKFISSSLLNYQCDCKPWRYQLFKQKIDCLAVAQKRNLFHAYNNYICVTWMLGDEAKHWHIRARSVNEWLTSSLFWDWDKNSLKSRCYLCCFNLTANFAVFFIVTFLDYWFFCNIASKLHLKKILKLGRNNQTTI